MKRRLMRLENASKRIKEWLNPPDFVSYYESARSSRQPGTGEWLFEKSTFRHWLGHPFNNRNDGSGRCLWVHGKGICLPLLVEEELTRKGNPGCGKTILAAALIEKLYHRYSINLTNSAICFYFFRAETSADDTAMAMYRSILAQILQQYRDDEEILDKFTFIMTDNSLGQATASRNDLANLLEACMQVRDIIVVLDGLDESSEVEEILQDLEKAIQHSTAKFVLFSRPSTRSLLRFNVPHRPLPIGQDNRNDIKSFVSTKLDQMITRRLLPSSCDKPILMNALCTGADRMFLWARLMFDYLGARSWTRAQRLNIISSITHPQGLESMYARIVDLIRKQASPDAAMAEWMIGLLVFSKRRLSCKETWHAIKEFRRLEVTEEPTEPDDETATEFLDMVLGVCASLVEIGSSRGFHFQPTSSLNISEHISLEPSTYFRFVHLSAMEYFSNHCDQSTSLGLQSRFITISKSDLICNLARVCLRYLAYRLPAQPLGGRPGIRADPMNIESLLPFCKYSAQYWPHHLSDALLTPRGVHTGKTCIEKVKTDVSRLLAQQFILMAWIEASYALGFFPDHGSVGLCSSSEYLDSNLPQFDNHSASIAKDLSDLSRYLKDLHHDWGEKLHQSPHVIWDEVTAFNSCQLLPQTSIAKVVSLPAGALRYDPSIDPLCKISDTTSDGTYILMLTVWPSK